MAAHENGQAKPADDVGFASYADYLRYRWSLDDWRHAALLRYLDRNDNHWSEKPLPGTGSVIQFGTREFKTYPYSDFESFLALRDFLLRGSISCEFQVVLRELPPWRDGILPFHPLEVDALGLGLDIPPIFWYSLITGPREVNGMWPHCESYIRFNAGFLLFPNHSTQRRIRTGKVISEIDSLWITAEFL